MRLFLASFFCAVPFIMIQSDEQPRKKENEKSLEAKHFRLTCHKLLGVAGEYVEELIIETKDKADVGITFWSKKGGSGTVYSTKRNGDGLARVRILLYVDFVRKDGNTVTSTFVRFATSEIDQGGNSQGGQGGGEYLPAPDGEDFKIVKTNCKSGDYPYGKRLGEGLELFTVGDNNITLTVEEPESK
jgi:hypothetical protein